MKYKLLKDLPGLPTGTVFELYNDGIKLETNGLVINENDSIGKLINDMIQTWCDWTKWFSPIDSTCGKCGEREHKAWRHELNKLLKDVVNEVPGSFLHVEEYFEQFIPTSEIDIPASSAFSTDEAYEWAVQVTNKLKGDN